MIKESSQCTTSVLEREVSPNYLEYIENEF